MGSHLLLTMTGIAFVFTIIPILQSGNSSSKNFCKLASSLVLMFIAKLDKEKAGPLVLESAKSPWEPPGAASQH